MTDPVAASGFSAEAATERSVEDVRMPGVAAGFAAAAPDRLLTLRKTGDGVAAVGLVTAAPPPTGIEDVGDAAGEAAATLGTMAALSAAMAIGRPTRRCWNIPPAF